MTNSEVENYEELCRLCASYDAIKMDIFSDKGKKRRLVDKITTCLPFEVSEDDLYPKSLCYRCIYNLETFYDFRRGCIAAKAKLETAIKQANEKVSRDRVISIEFGRKDNEDGVTLSDDDQRPNPADFLEACLGEAPSPQITIGPRHDEEWGPFCCKTCGRTFNSRSSLTIHAKYHQEKNEADKEVFSCYVCDKVFSSKGHLALHSRVHIGEANAPMLMNARVASPPAKLYRCDLCHKSYSMAKHLWGHVSTCHKGDPLVTCTLCMRTFSSIANLEDHRKVKHKDENFDNQVMKNPSNPASLLQPPQNPQKSSNEIVINLTHEENSLDARNSEENINKRKATKPRKIERDAIPGAPDVPDSVNNSENPQQMMSQDNLIYPCLLCPQNFNDPQKLNEHVHMVHGYENGLGFDNFRDYGENEYVNSMMEAETVFCCEICIREFNDRASLWLHILYSHREEAPNTCGVCLKICGDNETLGQHVLQCHRNKVDQTHKRYSCQVCARQHDSRKKLVAHAKIHNLTDQEGNLVDPETVVILNSDYYPHDVSTGGQTQMPSMQSDENHFLSSCEICFKVFESEAKLNKHKRGAHKDLNSSNTLSPYHFFFACELCGLSHLSRSDRWRHMVTTHSGDPAVTCQQPECGKVFPTSAVKREHEETHHAVQGQFPNTCEVCGKMWKTRVEYWKHMMGVHPDYLPFVCGVCLKVYTDLSFLVNHVRQTHWPLVGGDFCCDICGRPYSKLSKMTRHRKVHYVPTTCPEMRAILENPKIEGVSGSLKLTNDRHFLHPGDLPPLCCDLCQTEEERSVEYSNLEELGKHRFEKHNVMPCDLCPKYYGRTSHLWKHVNKIHKGHPDITCPVCHRTSASKSHLATHIAKHHKSSEDCDSYKKGADGEATCSKCNKVFRKESLVRKHVKHCKGPRPHPMVLPPPVNGVYTCERCSKSFTAENLLYKHMRSSHIMYKCEICQIKKTSKTDLYNHVRDEHGDDPNVRCAVRDCTQIMRCKADLDRHVRDHRQHNQLHICIFCAELVTSKFKLKRHLKSIHAAESKHLCFLCVKPLGSFEELRSHIVSAHAAALDRANTCPVCAKPCSNKSKLMEHIKYHGPTFHPCRICLKILPSKDDLEDHLNNHPTDSADEEDLQIDEAALDPDSIMDIIGAPPTDVKIKRNLEDEEEEDDENSSSKKAKIEYPCDKCESSFVDEKEFSEHCRTVHKENSKTSILESVLSEGKQQQQQQQQQLKNEENKREENTEDDDNHQMTDDARRKNGITSNNIKSRTDTDFMHQLGLMPDTSSSSSSDRLSITPVSKTKLVRKVYINDDVPSKCEMCGKEWPAKRHLWQHLIRYHRAEASTTCGVCLKYCSSYKRLSVHLAMEHPDIFDGDGTNLSCKVCGKYHNARSKLLNHATVHVGEEERAQTANHTCLLCHSIYTSFPEVATHMEAAHKSDMVPEKIRKPVKPKAGSEKLPFYTCEICSLVFASGIGLANHRRIHEHADRFKCGQCGEVCPSANALASHKLQRHQGTEFVCANCKAQFSTYIELTEHNKKCSKAKGRQQIVVADNSSVGDDIVVPAVEGDGEEDGGGEEEVDDDDDDEVEDEEEVDDEEEEEEEGLGNVDNGEETEDREEEEAVDDEEEETGVEDDEDGEEEEDEDDAVENNVDSTIEYEVDETKSEDEINENNKSDDDEEDEDETIDETVDEEPVDDDYEDEEEEEEEEGGVEVEMDENETVVEDDVEDMEYDDDNNVGEVDDNGGDAEEMEADEDEEVVEDDGEDEVEDEEEEEEGARTITEDQTEVKAIEAFMCEDNMVEVVQVDISDDCSSSKVNEV